MSDGGKENKKKSVEEELFRFYTNFEAKTSEKTGFHLSNDDADDDIFDAEDSFDLCEDRSGVSESSSDFKGSLSADKSRLFSLKNTISLIKKMKILRTIKNHPKQSVKMVRKEINRKLQKKEIMHRKDILEQADKPKKFLMPNSIRYQTKPRLFLQSRNRYIMQKKNQTFLRPEIKKLLSVY